MCSARSTEVDGLGAAATTGADVNDPVLSNGPALQAVSARAVMASANESKAILIMAYARELRVGWIVESLPYSTGQQKGGLDLEVGAGAPPIEGLCW